MTPRRQDLTGDDVPLFGEPVAERPRTVRSGVRTFAGPATTCFVCIQSVARGDPIPFPRSPATWAVTLDSGYVWLICSGHKAMQEAGGLTLQDPR